MADHPVTLHEDGTVSFEHAGNPYTLRRPMLGEVARFREAQHKVEDDTEADTAAALERLNAIRERLAAIGVLVLSDDGAEWLPVTPEPKLSAAKKTEVLDLGTEMKKLTRESFLSTEERRLALVVDIINTLGDGAELSTDIDKCEAWLAAPGLPGTLVMHFRTRPFPSGAS